MLGKIKNNNNNKKKTAHHITQSGQNDNNFLLVEAITRHQVCGNIRFLFHLLFLSILFP